VLNGNAGEVQAGSNSGRGFGIASPSGQHSAFFVITPSLCRDRLKQHGIMGSNLRVARDSPGTAGSGVPNDRAQFIVAHHGSAVPALIIRHVVTVSN
jgi:hypothetical protein